MLGTLDHGRKSNGTLRPLLKSSPRAPAASVARLPLTGCGCMPQLFTLNILDFRSWRERGGDASLYDCRGKHTLRKTAFPNEIEGLNTDGVPPARYARRLRVGRVPVYRGLGAEIRGGDAWPG